MLWRDDSYEYDLAILIAATILITTHAVINAHPPFLTSKMCFSDNFLKNLY